MMTGVVLCGGQSTRMGSDKGLLKHNSITWVEIAMNKFKALDLPVLLSINDQQYPLYSEIFQSTDLLKDDTTLNISGPLKGILSVHRYQPGEDLLVSACDMPEMHSDVLNHLVASKAGKNAEAFAFRNEEYIQPFSAIYTARGLQKIHALYKQGALSKFSLHHVFTVLNTCYLLLPPEWKSYFGNFNTPQYLCGK